MSENKDYSSYFEANRKLWDAKTPIHLETEFYEVPQFKNGDSTLRHVEVEEVGEVRGKSLLHLQCHFGMDTLSWARAGAKVMGVDFSPNAIGEAKKLSTELGIPAEFVCCNLYDLKDHLAGQFDIVFTSYGTIGWLPDLKRWAEIIHHFLKPGGMFYILDFHPFIWMYNWGMTDIEYSYFNDQVIEEVAEGTYADRSADITMTEYGWNHPTSEVLGALIDKGLEIQFFHEFPYTTWDCFQDLKEIGYHKYVFKKLGHKIPYMFSIKAVKKAINV